MKTMRALLMGLISLIVLLTGCATMQDHKPEKVAVVEKAPLAPMPVRKKNLEVVSDSLFQKSYSMQLFSDRRAYRVGDILTVKLSDKTEITKGSGTSLGKNSSVDIADPIIFGKTGAQILGGGRSLGFNIAPKRGFNGSSDLSRKNEIKESYISVQVIEILPNGSLRVAGEKWLRLNNDAEFVQVSGLIRPEDINTNNEVSSKRLAQANITYSGVGPEQDVHRQGWLSRALNSPWFPF
ncbi:flagellar basal body L-ring protein FlgH [Sansalvadorimonas verongulae]|uniref:flagellar basal body L-ring protein FlgH n=1 Tax=Sansalvadorimonas verongulae TaxID=2172824 RepID=UPI0012BC2023|nr:flagellar basal body L-ring protein FlgH [Sansalvadorimonas verongulae]MTI12485.1 flagellar basal body L-ring protein [Sansalvadorimonas verongulae]